MTAWEHGPLEGVHVLDLSRFLPGPYCTRILCDLGASVVKIEPPEGDPVAGLLPGLDRFLDRGKRIIRLDLRTDSGQWVARTLAARSSVVVEAFRPGVTDRLGLGFRDLVAVRPGLVYCSLSGFGQTGSRRGQPGHDLVYEASGGAFTGVLAAGEPLRRPHVPVGDLSGASFAATAIVAALHGGPPDDGVHLDVSLFEATAWQAVSRWGSYLWEGVEPDVANLANFAPGHQVYATADGSHIALGAVEDHFWGRLCTALGRPDLCAPPYDDHDGRMCHRVALERELAGELARLPASEVQERLVAADVPVTPVRTVAGVVEDGLLQERGALTGSGPDRVLDFPVRFGDRRSWASQGANDRDATLLELLDELHAPDDVHRALRPEGKN
jgi:crotonobetainyl-CoA:carnitine CoA-transferase CaiB-like acyl-CoA transferase